MRHFCFFIFYVVCSVDVVAYQASTATYPPIDPMAFEYDFQVQIEDNPLAPQTERIQVDVNTDPFMMLLENRFQNGDASAGVLWANFATGFWNFKRQSTGADINIAKKAFDFVSLAAERGFIPAVHYKSWFYQLGIGTERDPEKHIQLLAEAVSRGDIHARRIQVIAFRDQNYLSDLHLLALENDPAGLVFLAQEYQFGQLSGAKDRVIQLELLYRKCWELHRISDCGYYFAVAETMSGNFSKAANAINSIKENSPWSDSENSSGLALRTLYLNGVVLNGSLAKAYELSPGQIELGLRFGEEAKRSKQLINHEAAMSVELAIAWLNQAKFARSASESVKSGVLQPTAEEMALLNPLITAIARHSQNAAAISFDNQLEGWKAEASLKYAAFTLSSSAHNSFDPGLARQYADRLVSVAPDDSDAVALFGFLNEDISAGEAINICSYSCDYFQLMNDIEVQYQKALLAEMEKQNQQRRQKQQAKNNGAVQQSQRIEPQQKIAAQKRSSGGGFFSFLGDVLAIAAVVGVIYVVATTAPYAIGALGEMTLEAPTASTIQQPTWQSSQRRSQATSVNSLPSTCISDYSCGPGMMCIKQAYSAGGICATAVNEYGNKTFPQPRPDSFNVQGALQGCNFTSDCPIGFSCNRDYEVCVN